MLQGESEPKRRKSRRSIPAFQKGMRAVIKAGPLSGFAGTVERRTSDTQVHLRLDSPIVMRVEIADALLRPEGE